MTTATGFHRLMVFCAIALLSLAGLRSSCAQTNVTIAVATDSADPAWQQWADRLSSALPGYHFRIRQLSAAESVQQITSADFLVLDAVQFLLHDQHTTLIPIATAAHSASGAAQPSVSSTIFSSASRNDIVGLGDLRGKTLITRNNHSFADYYLAMQTLHDAGLEHNKTFKQLIVQPVSPLALVQQVLYGKADVGILPSHELQRLIAVGRIDPLDLVVLNPQPGDELSSTGRFPAELLVADADTNPSLRAQVQAALLAPGDNALSSLRSWQKPQDYSTMQPLLAKLKLGPYAETTFLRTVSRVLWLLAGIAITGLAIVHLRKDVTLATIVKPFLLFIIVGPLLFGIGLIGHLQDDHRATQTLLASSTVHGTASHIAEIVAQQRSVIKSLSTANEQLLLDLADFPADPDALEILQREVDNRLPRHLSYMLVSADGELLLDSKLPLVGPTCRANIREFTARHEPYATNIVVHGNDYANYHFDIMIRVGDGEDAPIFFASFYVDDILRTLRTSQAPGQSLVMVRSTDRFAVEMSVGGVFSTTYFGDTLSTESIQSILDAQPVAGTGWTLLALPDPALFTDFGRKLWFGGAVIYLVLLLVVGLFVYRLRREEQLRSAAQTKLADTLEHLEDTVTQRTIDLHFEKELAQITLSSIGDGVITTDNDAIITSINAVAERLTGWSSADAVGRNAADVFIVLDEETDQSVENPIQLCLQSRNVENLAANSILKHRTGQHIPVEDSAAPIFDRDGDLIGTVLVFHDVSQNRAYQRQIAHQATHDMLTGLINRPEFERRAQHLITQLQKHAGAHALLFMDLDRFKVVNDTCGHAAGDQLLKQLTEMLTHKLRARDTLARLGGDEFGVLLEHCPEDVALRIANQLREAIQDFRFFFEGQVFKVGCSIGLTSLDDSGISIDKLLARADAACYAAKEDGRNRVRVAADDLDDTGKEAQWYTRITDAYADGRMLLYQQPIQPIRADNEPRRYFEVLVRMLDESRQRLFPPGAFLPVAERYGIMPTLDRWVIKTTLAWLRAHAGELPQIGFVSINLSGQSITDDGFEAYVREQLAAHSEVSADKLCFEITETAAISNLDQARQLITSLRETGCRFALDDFGSGYSSYAYLKNLPVDILKIDGAFVKNIASDDIDAALVTSMNEIGQVMGMQTVAEFVEDEATLHRLQAIGFDFVQGFHVAKPEPLGDESPASTTLAARR